MIPNNVLSLLGRFNINVQEIQNLKTPNDVAQYLLNSGRVSQSQVNQAQQMWNDPNTRQRLFGKR